MNEKVVLVTGGTSGIGEATVEELVGAGACVAFTGRRNDLGEALQNKLGKDKCLYIEADHSNLADCQRSVEQTVAHFGRLDGLFNNAGIVLLERTAEQTSEEEWEQVMNLNVTAVWRMSKAALPHLRRSVASSSTSAIVNNASDWGLVGGREAAAYCTSKGAVVQMTRAMALDHAKEGVRINAVCPGDTFVKRWLQRDRHMVVSPEEEEEGGQKVEDEEVERRLRVSHEIPMGRVGDAKEVARVVVFLLNGELSSFMTGVCLPVDGGNTAQ
ncbi:putative 3-oxoacyl-(Acyl-carrier protein) reductase [Balamuthia mandrillaris]